MRSSRCHVALASLFAATACTAESEYQPQRQIGVFEIASEGESRIPPAPLDPVDQLAAEEKTEYPVDTITLDNGNILQFYANPEDGWWGVIEAGFDAKVPPVLSTLRAMDPDLNAIDLYLSLTPPDHEMPQAMQIVAEQNGIEIGNGRGRNFSDAIAIELPNQLGTHLTWCPAEEDNATEFDDEFCDVGGGYIDYLCSINNVMGPPGTLVHATPATYSIHAGFCQPRNYSFMLLRYLSGCGGGSWTNVYSSYAVYDDELWGSAVSYRSWEHRRTPGQLGSADTGIKWGTEHNCAG